MFSESAIDIKLSIEQPYFASSIRWIVSFVTSALRPNSSWLMVRSLRNFLICKPKALSAAGFFTASKLKICITQKAIKFDAL